MNIQSQGWQAILEVTRMVSSIVAVDADEVSETLATKERSNGTQVDNDAAEYIRI